MPGEPVIFCLLAGGESVRDEPTAGGFCVLVDGDSTDGDPEPRVFCF
jgi:hypothetical protein